MFYDPTAKPETKLEPWRGVALKAANLIERRGHAKFVLEDSAGKLCIFGAINMSGTGVSWSNSLAGTELMGVLAKDLGGSDMQDVVRWNNQDNRTAREVVDLLRKVARSRDGRKCVYRGGANVLRSNSEA